MSFWVPMEELRAAVNITDTLSAYAKDIELTLYLRAAQAFAEKYCKRKFDGKVTRTEYPDAYEPLDAICLTAYPIISVTSIKNDSSRNFSLATAFSASDYITFNERGEIAFVATKLSRGEKAVQVIYSGGYIPETTVVAAAAGGATMTIANSLSAYGQEFTLWVQTGGTPTAGTVVITGTDINDAALTETITFTGVVPSRKVSLEKWKTVTIVNSSGISTGTVKVVATSFPEDFRAALLLYVMHLYYQDQEKSMNISSRSVSQKSESGYLKEIPKEVLQLLAGYRSIL